ncbi:hypothetical protein B0H14DRAFT_3457513 [Mycena olivaceomarginata]|nr:hypothetical protein B0H14DRAFT_3457513 [Mycena olivaceomarginata]
MRAPRSVLLEFMHMLNGALDALIQLRRKYDCTNILAAAVAHITRINPTTLDAYDDACCSSTGCTNRHRSRPTAGSPSNSVLVHENSHSGCHLPDGLAPQDGTRASLPPLDLRRCLIGREHLLVNQFQPGPRKHARLQSPTCAAQVHILPLHGQQRRCGAAQARQGVPDALRCVCQGGWRGDWAGRRKMWEELPGCFELPAWEL